MDVVRCENKKKTDFIKTVLVYYCLFTRTARSAADHTHTLARACAHEKRAELRFKTIMIILHEVRRGVFVDFSEREKRYRRLGTEKTGGPRATLDDAKKIKTR